MVEGRVRPECATNVPTALQARNFIKNIFPRREVRIPRLLRPFGTRIPRQRERRKEGLRSSLLRLLRVLHVMKLVETLLVAVVFLGLVLLLKLVLMLLLQFRLWILVAHGRGGSHCRLERTAGGDGGCQPGPRRALFGKFGPIPKSARGNSGQTKPLDRRGESLHDLFMATLAEIEVLAFELSESDRAKLAAGLLHSLPAILADDDDGVAEALRRSKEMDLDPSCSLTHEEFLKAVGRPA